MKFFLICFLIILKFEITAASERIAFIDLNFIINNSVAGKSINNYINNLNKEKNDHFKKIESEIKKDENDLISKKNIIEKNIFNEKVNKIKLRINNYKIEKQKFDQNLSEKKFKYNNQLISKLNPIISNYVEKNSLSIVLPKKMIIIAKKDLDITKQILEIFDKTFQKINFDE